MEKTKIASGIFGWGGIERQSARYGYIILLDRPYDGAATVTTTFDADACKALVGERVKLTAVVTDTRQSGHAGDRYYQIFPSTPEVGQSIVVGVGTFATQPCTWAPGGTEIGLEPEDGREELWLDPRILYRLHDQTVDLYAETTDEPFSPAPDLAVAADPEKAISNGDGSYQFRTKRPVTKIKMLPNVAKLGDGLFSMEGPHATDNAGEQFDIEM